MLTHSERMANDITGAIVSSETRFASTTYDLSDTQLSPATRVQVAPPFNFLDPRLPPRFWKKVSPCPMSGCWIWTASTDCNGYGMWRWHDVRSCAHRFSLVAARGPIAPDLVIDHLCRVRPCVNPAHLEAVTDAENLRRWLLGVLMTHCKKGHAVTAATYEAGGRGCLLCCRAHQQRYERREPQSGTVRYARGAVTDYDRMIGRALAGENIPARAWDDVSARLAMLAKEPRRTPEQSRKLIERAADAVLRSRRATSRESSAAAMEVA